MSGAIKKIFGGGGGGGFPGIASGAPGPPGDRQAPNLPAGLDDTPQAAAAPAVEPVLPDLGDASVQEAKKKERKPKGRAATILTGSQGLLSSPFLARRVLLGS